MSVEPNIKNRVTGAIVLVALAVIFLPLILDGQKKNQILESQIPDKPIKGEIILVNVEDIGSNPAESTKKQTQSDTESEQNNNNPKTITETPITEVPKAENQKTVKQNESKKTVVKKQPEIKTTKKAPAQVVVSKPTEVRRDRPNYKSAAFVIQLGSFGNKTNASKLVSRLKKAGHKAYLRNGKSNGRTIHRVLVGPILKRKMADAKIAPLAKLSGLKPIVVTYDPLKH